jgi:hypothetical protein
MKHHQYLSNWIVASSLHLRNLFVVAAVTCCQYQLVYWNTEVSLVEQRVGIILYLIIL